MSEAIGRLWRAGRVRLLTAWYGRARRPLRDAVFFYVDLGSGTADSAGAIHRELQARGSRLRLYWGVSDANAAVPGGGIAVPKMSRAWFAALNSSRYVVNNYGGVGGLVKHRDQRYLQTWHGTPYKFVGVSEARHGGAPAGRLERIVGEAAQWDAVVSPSPYMSALIRSDLRYTGPILETGYPRNDRLATAGPGQTGIVRARLGLPRGARVVLYAPTYREHQRDGWRAEPFTGLDLDRLLRKLGDGWSVLLRGHSFVARSGPGSRSRGAIVDVTGHPDVNDLYLAADVLVTDYSSAMFDFAVTGKPMAFFVPDIDRYASDRGVYFDLAELAPGPLYTEVGELAAGLRDLDGLRRTYAGRYAAFRDRFAPWDDGRAAARVVERFFGRDATPGPADGTTVPAADGAARAVYDRLPQNLQRRVRTVQGYARGPIGIGAAAIARRREAADGTGRGGALLSVVMPVYNVEAYLGEAVRSVLSQRVNLELVLVDDGSTDGSAALADRFAAADRRVRVVHQRNAGLGAARNRGVEEASGQFLAFVDSDDYLLPGAYRAMLAALERSGSSLVTANVRRRDGWQLSQAWNQSRSHRTDRRHVTLREHPDLVYDTVAWNKVFRTRYWRTRVGAFPTGATYEDTLPVFTALLAADGIDVLSRPAYVWRRRDGRDSITGRLLQPGNITDRFAAIDAVGDLVVEHGLADVLGPRLTAKILEGDLWVYVEAIAGSAGAGSAGAGGAGEAVIEAVAELTRRYWSPAPWADRARLAAGRRVCYWLVERGRGGEVPAFWRWYGTVWPRRSRWRDDSRRLLDVDRCPVPLDGIGHEYLDLGGSRPGAG